ncbi:MAG: UDP-glucose 6-dehydrogenase [Betaproteobacteria bacterium TMED41]|nr:MAG: UDP-glucose 6-dehydrogenase [Betaproteobacteria bacterium TMED41]|tara:strand:- start:6180 stop:7496 length:1317 start_codon:yes stop_codon:yes gene_type:complete
MNITIVGTGYVGLVTGACLADVGNTVLCMDLNKSKISKLNSGFIPIYEPGLATLVEKNFESGRLKFTDDIEKSVDHGDIQFIAVGTPSEEDGSADLHHVLQAAKNIGKYMKKKKIVVDKSTVPVGTADEVKKTISVELSARNENHEFSVVSNPEFLKEGAAILDFQKPDRIIIGTDSHESAQIMRRIYAPFQRNRDKIIIMDIRSAELTKYAANAMLATRISFMNELANLAEKLGADIEHVRQGIGSDSRIGYSFLYPGCGYGGSCFPKDVKALIKTAFNLNQKLEILSAVETANENQKLIIVKKIVDEYGENLEGRLFAIWGLSFKPGTDDMRHAPSLSVIQDLLKRGASIKAYDPVAMEESKKIFKKKISYAENPLDALNDAEALLILTEWKEFRSPDFAEISKRLKGSRIFDGRNIYDPIQVRSNNLHYEAIGRQ